MAGGSAANATERTTRKAGTGMGLRDVLKDVFSDRDRHGRRDDDLGADRAADAAVDDARRRDEEWADEAARRDDYRGDYDDYRGDGGW
jgi:hypothetical protein